jgi:Protein of unknown function (DUF3431).
MLFFRSGVHTSRLRHRAKPIALAILIVYGIYSLFFTGSTSEVLVSARGSSALKGSRLAGSKDGQAPLVPLPPLEIQKELVVASMSSDNTSWLFEHFPDWHKSIYVVDDRDAELTVEMNKGRESMVYLTCASFFPTRCVCS